MHNARFDYSSTHIELPRLSREIIDWSHKNVSDDDIFVSFEDFSYGREDEIHITILYGIHAETSEPIRELLADQAPIQGELSKVKVFSNSPKFDVIVIGIRSPDLFNLHYKLAGAIPFKDKYHTYNPHVTVAYVKKGKGWKHHGLTLWEGHKFISDYLIFSSKNGTKDRMVFQGRVV